MNSFFTGASSTQAEDASDSEPKDQYSEQNYM